MPALRLQAGFGVRMTAASEPVIPIEDVERDAVHP
jgi:hypothetical protein